jgi:MFS transporter, PAT family, beta-lactamase induction signal transducer AmpG
MELLDFIQNPFHRRKQNIPYFTPEMNKDISAATGQTRIHAHPFVFLFLILPFGIINGYVTVTFAYLFSKAGISVEAIAALVAASLLPQVFKFLWAPLVDTSFSLKKWYVLSGVITALGILATGILPVKESSLPLLTVIVVVANVAVSFLGIAVSGLAAHDTPDELKGRAGGYLQAGNLGGGGIGGGAGLWLAEHSSHNWMPAAVLAFTCMLCCLGLFFVKEHPSTVRAEKVVKTLENLFKDIWLTFKSRLGILAMVLCFLPLCTGAASNLWAAVAGDWQASANTVAFVTGLMSGIITAAGCLLGGWICDRGDRQIAYVVFGLMQAICAVVMAYAPHTEMMYIILTSLYAFTIGLSYAGFSAFVFEAIGKGAAATKYTVYASLSNAPIYYMTLVDGWAHTHYGPAGMLNTEAAFAVLGIVLFIGLLKFANARKVVVI